MPFRGSDGQARDCRSRDCELSRAHTPGAVTLCFSSPFIDRVFVKVAYIKAELTLAFSAQPDLFGKAEPVLPIGFRYKPGVVPKPSNRTSRLKLPQLPLKPFDFHGSEGKRRVVSYGWKYDFDAQ